MQAHPPQSEYHLNSVGNTFSELLLMLANLLYRKPVIQSSLLSHVEIFRSQETQNQPQPKEEFFVFQLGQDHDF